MHMSRRRNSVATIIWFGVLAGLLVTFVLAPIVNGGWCADAPAGYESTCGSFQKSLLGFDTNVFLWLGALAVVVVATLVVLRRRRVVEARHGQDGEV